MSLIQRDAEFSEHFITSSLIGVKEDNYWDTELAFENELIKDYEGIDKNEEDLEKEALEYFQRKALFNKGKLIKL